MTFFDEVFLDGEHGNELNVDFLKQHNYGVKNVYFDRIVNPNGHNGYRVFYAYYKKKPEVNIFFTLNEAFGYFLSYPASDRIFEFIDRELFIFMIEADHYQIFGAKEQLTEIYHYDYSDEYAKKRLIQENDAGAKKYYQWLYDTYQHL